MAVLQAKVKTWQTQQDFSSRHRDKLRYDNPIMLTLRDDNLQRRFSPLFAAAFFQGFVLWYAIEKLFMKTIGFNDQTIAVETVIFTVVMVAANIPLGILADR